LNTLKEILTKRYNFQLSLQKCSFLKTTIEYLGYIISPKGITLSSRHTEAVAQFPQSKKVLELQRFLGLTNYFRKFVKDYASITMPLTLLLRKTGKFEFDENCVQAFDTLKSKLTSYPILQLYNLHLNIELHTDTSSLVIAGILLQKQENGQWSPVAFYSQNTNKAEANSYNFELEMLAIVKSVERFRIYLYDLDFIVITDCHALVYVS